MTVGNILVRNHNALAKACLGGGFAFGFAYTNNHGTNPIRDAATAAGTRARPRDPPLSVRASPNATANFWSVEKTTPPKIERASPAVFCSTLRCEARFSIGRIARKLRRETPLRRGLRTGKTRSNL